MPLSVWKRCLAAAVVASAPALVGESTALAAPTPAEVTKATDMFKKATELFKNKKLALALEEFKKSHALVASPNSHLYIARCLAGLGNARAAWIEFDRTADEATAGGPKYTPTHDSALQERDELSSKLSLVTVAVLGSDPATTVRMGSNDVPADRWGKPFPVEPGTYEVVIQVPGQPPQRQSITVNPGERREVTPSAAAPVAPPTGGGTGPSDGGGPGPATPSRGLSGLQIGAIVGGAVGVAGIIMFAVEGSASKSTYNSLSTACGGAAGCGNANAATRANADNLISTGTRQQAIANAGIALGVIGLAAGTTLLVISLRKPPPSDAARPSAQLVVGPTWLGARGSF